jgi:short-subunit dehydrogenase
MTDLPSDDATPVETTAVAAPSQPALEDAWVVFGASSGIARAFSRIAARHGKPLVLAGRDVEDLALDGRDLVLRGSPAVRTLSFDADAPHSFGALATMLDTALPQAFNVLLAFAALPHAQDIARDPDLARRVIDTNTGAPIALIQHLAPLMQRRGGGRLMVLGSVAGDRVRPGNPVYGASKMALHGFVQSIAPQLAKSGVAVCLVKPGPIDTPMTYGRAMALPPASAEDCAQAMWRAAEKNRRVIYFPAMLRWVMAVVRLLPEFIVTRLAK